MSEINLLTKKLLAEGYTKENPPDYVRPWNDFYGGFKYSLEHQEKMVFETGCGLHVKGSHWICGDMSYKGIVWSLENDNPTIRCPYNQINCEKNHPLLRNHKALGYTVHCCCHEISEEYNYAKSIDKIYDEKKLHEKELFEEFKLQKHGRVCSLMCHFDKKTSKWKQIYDPIVVCARQKCKYCTILNRELNSKKGNVFYDVKEVKADTVEGLLNLGDIVTVTKGIRFLEKNCSIDICEIIAKKFKHEIESEFRMKHHSELFFAEYHNIKYDFEIINVRTETRESRDLEQDLEDIKSGITVIHDSDQKVAAEQLKIERKQNRIESQVKKYRKMITEKGFKHLDIAEKRRIEKMVKKGLMQAEELVDEPDKRNEQITLF